MPNQVTQDHQDSLPPRPPSSAPGNVRRRRPRRHYLQHLMRLVRVPLGEVGHPNHIPDRPVTVLSAEPRHHFHILPSDLPPIDKNPRSLPPSCESRSQRCFRRCSVVIVHFDCKSEAEPLDVSWLNRYDRLVLSLGPSLHIATLILERAEEMPLISVTISPDD